LVFRARDLDRTLGRHALGEVLTRYRGPLLRHLEWKFQASPEQAEDWLQSFIAHKVLEYGLLQHADQALGRFRTFLLGALDRFVWDEVAKARAQKRAPAEGFAALEAAEAIPAPTTTGGVPDPGDVAWAREVVARAVEQTRRWYESAGNQQTWEVFRLGRIRPLLEGRERPSDAAIGAQCGLASEKVSNVLNNAARKFRTELQAVVREYASHETEVEAELRGLLEILRKAR
jgi:RNA polymerase sigma-70 factor (ECF subfamily)